MPAASQDLRKELNGAEEDGPEHDARIFGEVMPCGRSLIRGISRDWSTTRIARF